MAPTPLILDVDTGVDDAMALLFAAASPEVELIGATCVMGNVTVEQATLNTLAVWSSPVSRAVEVARGAGRPLVREHQPYPEVHGVRGLGHADLPHPASGRPRIVRPSRSSWRRRGRVRARCSWSPRGRSPTSRSALAEEPRLPDLLKGFAIMGGAFAKAGNVTPTAEANIWVDPEAAQAVFRAFVGVPARAAAALRRTRRHRAGPHVAGPHRGDRGTSPGLAARDGS